MILTRKIHLMSSNCQSLLITVREREFSKQTLILNKTKIDHGKIFHTQIPN